MTWKLIKTRIVNSQVSVTAYRYGHTQQGAEAVASVSVARITLKVITTRAVSPGTLLTTELAR